MKPGCPGRKLLWGHWQKDSWTTTLLSSLLCEPPGVSRRPGRVGWLGKAAACTCTQPLHGVSVSAGGRGPTPSS